VNAKDAPPRTTRVVVVTGSLGCGKTAFINHQLRQPSGARAIVVKGIAGRPTVAERIAGAWRVVSLPMDEGIEEHGFAARLAQELARLVAERGGAGPVFVEMHGLTDAQPVVQGLYGASDWLDDTGVATVTVVDARRSRLPPGCADVLQRNLLAADLFVLNKCDCVPPSDVRDGRDWLANINPHTPCVESIDGRVDASLLRALSPVRGAAVPRPDRRPDSQVDDVYVHGHRHVDSFAFHRWLSALYDRYGANLLRIKGEIALWGQPHPVAVEVVGRAVQVLPLDTVPREEGFSELTVIGRHLDAEDVLGGFRNCLREAWEGTHEGHGTCHLHGCR